MTLQTDLGKGESECIVLAKEINADFVVLDDKDAKKMAEFLGLDYWNIGHTCNGSQERRNKEFKICN